VLFRTVIKEVTQCIIIGLVLEPVCYLSSQPTTKIWISCLDVMSYIVLLCLTLGYGISTLLPKTLL